MTIVVGRPLAAAAPIPEEIRPSIPLAPRLQRNRTSVSAPRQERLLVADRHARGGVDEVAVAVGAAERGVQARLGGPPERVELGVDRRSRRPRGAEPGVAPRTVASHRPRAVRRAAGERRRVGAEDRRRRSGSARSSRRAGRRRSASAPARREPWPQRLAGRHLAEAQDEVGDERVADAPARAARRRRRPCERSWGPSAAARSARRGSGKPAPRASSASGSRSPGRAGRPATISPRGAASMCSATSSSQRLGDGARRRSGTAVSGPSRRGPRAPAARSRSRPPGRGSGPAARARGG